nr:MAG TPA: SlyX-like protein [Caudoviricetes sp.]
MNINEIIASIEELTVKVAYLEKVAANLKSTVESLSKRVSALENQSA